MCINLNINKVIIIKNIKKTLILKIKKNKEVRLAYLTHFIRGRVLGPLFFFISVGRDNMLSILIFQINK
jgi:hypothetical protein